MQFEKGLSYHVYNRSINREPLFRSDENYRYFMEKFDFYLHNKIDVLAYCLMPTHFHFFIRAEDDSAIIEKAFNNFFIAYAKAYNAVYERTGSIFQAKYKKDAIADDFHLTNVIAYIHLNPVKAGLCEKPGDWKCSSFNAIISNINTKVKRAEVLEWFGSKANFISFHQGYYGNEWIEKNLPE